MVRLDHKMRLCSFVSVLRRSRENISSSVVVAMRGSRPRDPCYFAETSSREHVVRNMSAIEGDIVIQMTPSADADASHKPGTLSGFRGNLLVNACVKTLVLNWSRARVAIV